MKYSWRHRIKYSVVVFLLSVNAAMSQPAYFNIVFKHAKDSLVNELRKYPAADTSRAVALFRVLSCATFLNQKKEVLPYWSEAIYLGRKLKFKKVEAACLEWKGSYYKSAQNTDSALIYLDSAIALAGNSSEKWLKTSKAFALFQKGMIYESQENLFTSIKYYLGSLENTDSSELINQRRVVKKLAGIYEELNNDDKALQYYNDVLRLVKKSNDTTAQNRDDGVYVNIAKIYFKKNDLSNAKYYLSELNPIMPDAIQTIVTGDFYRLSGQIALKEQKTDSAFLYYKEALKYYSLLRQMHTDVIAYICIDMARLKMESGDMSDAKEYAGLAIAAAKESNHKATMVPALICMAGYYHKEGDEAGAYNALHHATLLNDSVLAEANLKQAITLAAIYENDKKEKEISQLQADGKMREAIVKQKTLLNSIFIIALAAILLTASLLFRNFKHKQMLNTQQQFIQQQKISQLEKEKQLMAVEAMLKGQEEERTRLAKDLHDGLGGMLSGIKISFSNMKENMIMDATNLAVFERSILQLDNTIEELRKVSHNLMPEALVKFGLKSAVKDFCESIQVHGNTKIICEQLGVERELGNKGDINAYRIIQELVTNAVKYAQASQIMVQLTKTPNKVMITVEDNGKGFDLSTLEKTPGIGLTNIKYRVNYLNGTIEINSKPGDGTTVNIELIV